MWVFLRLFNGYSMTPDEIMKKNKEQCRKEHLTVDEFMRACKALEANNLPSHTHSYTIASNPPMPNQVYVAGNGWADLYSEQKEEKNMCYAKTNYNTAGVSVVSQPTVEATQRDYFSSRVSQVQRKLIEGLREQFNMDAPDRPRTFAELLDKIQSGDYTYDQKKVDEVGEEAKYYNWDFGVTWTKANPDRKGYEAAVKAVKEEAQRVVDAGTLSGVDGLLALLTEFQNWTYAPKAEKSKK